MFRDCTDDTLKVRIRKGRQRRLTKAVPQFRTELRISRDGGRIGRSRRAVSVPRGTLCADISAVVWSTGRSDLEARLIAIDRVAADVDVVGIGPLGAGEWGHVVSTLELSPQQQRIVELILTGMPDKQIAREMGVGVPTVRTYLTRVFQRTGTSGRVDLVTRVFACAQEWRQKNDLKAQQPPPPQQTGGHPT